MWLRNLCRWLTFGEVLDELVDLGNAAFCQRGSKHNPFICQRIRGDESYCNTAKRNNSSISATCASQQRSLITEEQGNKGESW